MIDFSQRANNYVRYRVPDVRFVKYLEKELNVASSGTIVEIGAGTGAYLFEFYKLGYIVAGVEPEEKMRMHSRDELLMINSTAECIDLPNNYADGVYIINALHHFSNLKKALNEIKRIMRCGNLVIATFDPYIACKKLWQFDYWPFLKEYEFNSYLDIDTIIQSIEDVFRNKALVKTYEIPYDFSDKFSAAVWKRPDILLNKDAVQAMSVFNAYPKEKYYKGFFELSNDIKSGIWKDKYYYLCNIDKYDCGFRIITVKNENA